MKRFALLVAALSLCTVLGLAGCALTGCAAGPDPETSSSASAEASGSASEGTADATVSESSSPSITDLADGDYVTVTKTDSSMFHPTACTLHVQGGTYSATIVMPGEGFSRLYFGTADEAENAPEDEIYDYYLNDEGKYAFDIPVSALEKELTIAAFGQRRDRWYDHTIIVYSPENNEAAESQTEAA